ncbi:MAG: class I SAM-dependent methyltransferase [Candidatus Micrarchaeota archaeon]
MGWKVRNKRPEDGGNAEEFYSQPGAQVYEKNAMRHIQEKILMRALQLVEVPAGARVLDAGCGTGFGMQLLKKLGFSASGFDVSPDMVAFAKRKKLAAVAGDLRKIPFPDKSFDAIVSISALQWVPLKERAKVAKEFHRVLAGGGVAVIQFYPASEDEAMATGRLFRQEGFRVVLHVDSEDNPRKRKVFLVIGK